MSLVIRQLGPEDCARWDAYVAAHPSGTFCHRAGWKQVVETGAGQASPFILAERAGVMAGIMPLSLRRSALFGKAAISSMFAVYGGALADDDAVATALENEAWSLCTQFGADSLEIRSVTAPKGDAWQVPEPRSATFRRPIAGDDDALLTAIPRKQRAVVRKALGGGLSSDWGADMDAFYRLYAHSVHGLGTPVFPKKLFTCFMQLFGADAEIQIVRNGAGQAVASLMSFYHGNHVLPYYAGSNALARGLGAHDFMYFDLMKRARDKGKTLFDFGRSKIGSGPYAFKKNWGFEAVPLNYAWRLAPGASMPDLSPVSGKFALMSRLWRHMPLWLANRLGPPLARHLG